MDIAVNNGASQPAQPGSSAARARYGEGQPVRDYDVVVIGGGPQGTAIAYDLATRRPTCQRQSAAKNPNTALSGLKVLLLEKNDIGAGTSAYSSRLIHGGLRYLAQGMQGIRLVRESLKERELLLHNAPHLVRPLQLVLPVYPHSKYGAWMMKAGMVLYDMLSLGKSIPNHRTLSRDQLLKTLSAPGVDFQKQPAINPQGLQGGAIYYDGQVNLPERLCLEAALAAQESGNAEIRNHAEVVGIQPVAHSELQPNRSTSEVHYRDNVTGEESTARAKVVINAAGPWVDELIRRVDGKKAGTGSEGEIPSRLGGGFNIPSRMGGTKGTHIIIRKPPGSSAMAFYSEARADQRPFFILPWREDYYLIGTTDVRYKDSLDKIVASEEEIDYLLREANQVLRMPDGHALSRADVLYHYAGVRPLPKTPENRKEGDITREHRIDDHGRRRPEEALFFPGLVSIVGGKLTTARALAQQVGDHIISAYRLTLPEGGKPGPSRTQHLPLPGARGMKEPKAASMGWLSAYKTAQAEHARRTFHGVLPDETLNALVPHLIDLYGSRYDAVLSLAKQDPEGRWPVGELARPLYPGGQDIAAQVVYAVRHEMARTVEDVLLRRICCGLDADLGMRALPAVAKLMATELGWDASRQQREMDAYVRAIRETRLAHLPRSLEIPAEIST